MMSKAVPIRSTTGMVYQVYAVQPRQWPCGGHTIFALEEWEQKYFNAWSNGARIRTERPIIESLAVRIIIEKDEWQRAQYSGVWEIKCKIEFFGDGSPSTFTTGRAFFEVEPSYQPPSLPPWREPEASDSLGSQFALFSLELQEEKELLAGDQVASERQQAYIQLNNLYLQIESGQKRITTARAKQLRKLANMAYEPGDELIEWWGLEFQKLPGWFRV